MEASFEQPLVDATPLPPTPPPAATGIFLGPFGLRAGWSMSIFVVLFLLIATALSLAQLAATGNLKKVIDQRKSHTAAQTTKPAQPSDSKPRGVVTGEALAFTATALATLVLALIERRRMAVYGIDWSSLLNILPGAFWGLASLSLLVFALRACHVLVFDKLALSGPAVYLYGAKWLLAFLMVGLFEEYSTRGFLQFTLTRGMMGLGKLISPKHTRAAAFWIAATIMSIVFGALHLGNGGETVVGILMVFCAGMLFSYALWRTGSLWWAIGFHMAWDWAQSFLYGVPDSGNVSAGRLFFTHATGKPLLSGGADGPEGSVLVLPTLLLVAFIIRYTTRPAAQPPLEAQPAAAAPHALTA